MSAEADMHPDAGTWLTRKAFPVPSRAMRKTSLAALAAAILVGAPLGCGFTPEIPKAQDLAAIEKGGKDLTAYERAVEDGFAAWARRHESPDFVKKAVEHWERAYAIDATDRVVLQELTKATYYLANYYAPDASKKDEWHERGTGFGLAATLLNPKIRDAVEGRGVDPKTGEKRSYTVEEAIAAFAEPADVPGLYWMTVNRARAVENRGIAARAAAAPKLKAVMETIYRLVPSYYYGGVHRFFGAYYIKAPAVEDKLNNSKREFDLAVKAGPENLENTVLYAEYYAKAGQDRELFDKLLKSVVATRPEKDFPALRLDNAEARKRAKRMLETADEDF